MMYVYKGASVVGSERTFLELHVMKYKQLLLVVFNSSVVLIHLSIFTRKGWGGHVFVICLIVIHHGGVFVTLHL
jgi:hypothetical protein